jgi:hypothetical protein
MFEKVLFGKSKNILALLVKSGFLEDAYLAGGTACALQLGHRISYDLDFFTQKKFKPLPLVKKLEKIEGFKLERTAWETILGRFDRIRFSLFYYSYPLLYSPKNFRGIKIADLRDIAAMKIVAISERGTKRDFIDLYAICHKIPLQKCLTFYNRKYRKLASNLFHILKSLTYFEDAEGEVMPKMLIPLSWEEVKKFFAQEVKNLGKKIIKQ